MRGFDYVEPSQKLWFPNGTLPPPVSFLSNFIQMLEFNRIGSAWALRTLNNNIPRWHLLSWIRTTFITSITRYGCPKSNQSLLDAATVSVLILNKRGVIRWRWRGWKNVVGILLSLFTVMNSSCLGKAHDDHLCNIPWGWGIFVGGAGYWATGQQSRLIWILVVNLKVRFRGGICDHRTIAMLEKMLIIIIIIN